MTRPQALATLAAAHPDEPSILAARCVCPAELVGGARVVCAACDAVAVQKATARGWAKRLKVAK